MANPRFPYSAKLPIYSKEIFMSSSKPGRLADSLLAAAEDGLPAHCAAEGRQAGALLGADLQNHGAGGQRSHQQLNRRLNPRGTPNGISSPPQSHLPRTPLPNVLAGPAGGAVVTGRLALPGAIVFCGERKRGVKKY